MVAVPNTWPPLVPVQPFWLVAGLKFCCLLQRQGGLHAFAPVAVLLDTSLRGSLAPFLSVAVRVLLPSLGAGLGRQNKKLREHRCLEHEQSWAWRMVKAAGHGT